MSQSMLVWVSVALAVSEGLALIPGLPKGFSGILASAISILKKLGS